jgi:hypothetical protein
MSYVYFCKFFDNKRFPSFEVQLFGSGITGFLHRNLGRNFLYLFVSFINIFFVLALCI